MNANEYREHTEEELRSMSVDLRQDLFQLRFQHATGQMDDVSRMHKTRRDLARVETLLREHELGIRKLASGGKAAVNAEG